MNDLRFAFRQLLKAPGFTAVTVLTLGLGIGACTAIFSVVDWVLLRAAPFHEPGRVVALQEVLPAQSRVALVSFGAYHDWLAQATRLQSVGALMRTSYNLAGAGAPVHPSAARISASALPTLGVHPLLGRNFLPEEELGHDRENVAILSHGFWQRRFGGRAEALGGIIQMNGRPFTVVGVMPREAPLASDVEIFTPLGFWQGDRRNYQAHWLEVFARLRPGATQAEAQAELNAITRRASERRDRPGWEVRVSPLVESTVGEVRPVLLSLLGAVGFLLLIACANVANLLLARATARVRELAVRVALGASRGRLVRQLLIESLLLSLLGGALGVLVADVGLQALLALAPEGLPRAQEIAVDGRALGFTLALATLTGVGFGLLPAFQTTGGLGQTLKQAGRTTDGGRRQRLRGALVIAEVAVALILLTGAGLLMRSFARLQEVNPGFDPRDTVISTVFLPRTQYREPARYLDFARQAVEQIAARPGVQAAAVATNIPFTDPSPHAFRVPGQPVTGDLPVANHSIISPDYFRAMGIPLLRGRAFDGGDRGDTPRVVIVSQSLARQFFPGQDPLGKSLDLGRRDPHRIVGVVGDVKASKLEGGRALQTYEPFEQTPIWEFTLVVRGGGAGLPAALAAVIGRLDPGHPINARPLDILVGDSLARQRFAMTLFVVFSGAALLLAAIGLYGVIAYNVSQRTGEIGIRMALGAQAGHVVRLVLGQGGRLVGLGMLAGLAGALALTRFLSPLLFGVGAQDPLTYVTIALLLAAVAAVACLLPARRAARVDPMIALRGQ